MQLKNTFDQSWFAWTSFFEELKTNSHYRKQNGLTHKRLVVVGWRWVVMVQFEPPCGFSRTAFFSEGLKPCPYFFVTFNIIIRHLRQLFWKCFWNSSTRLEDIKIFFVSINYIINFLHFLTLPCYKNKLMTSAYNRWCKHFFSFQPILIRLFNKFIKLCWYCLSSSWNMIPQEKTAFENPCLIRVKYCFCYTAYSQCLKKFYGSFTIHKILRSEYSI